MRLLRRYLQVFKATRSSNDRFHPIFSHQILISRRVQIAQQNRLEIGLPVFLDDQVVRMIVLSCIIIMEHQ